MHLHTTTVPTPVGPFTLLVDTDGVCAAGFTGRPETLQRRLDPRRRTAGTRQAADPDALASRVGAYLAGEVDALDEVAVEQPGDPARQAAWRALRRCRPARRSATASSGSWPAWPTRPPTRSAPRPPAPPAPATTSPSSCPATACSAPTAAWAAMGGACTARPGSSTTRPPPWRVPGPMAGPQTLPLRRWHCGR